MVKRLTSLIIFGGNVRQCRLAHGLTQAMLSELSGLDQTYISGIENGLRNPTIESAVRLAKALKTTVAQLCGGIEK